jgi:hypothetical protein
MAIKYIIVFEVRRCGMSLPPGLEEINVKTRLTHELPAKSSFATRG